MNNDLLAAFGITEEDLKKETTEKKKQSSTQGKKKKNDKKKVTEYTLPVRFCGGYWQTEIPGEGFITKDLLLKRIEEEFRELTGMISDFEEITEIQETERKSIKTYLKPVITYTSVKEETKLSFPLSIMCGSIGSLPIEEEQLLGEISARWSEIYPVFNGCEFHYNEKENVLIPFFIASEPAGVEYDLPVTVGLVIGEIEVMAEQDDEKQVSYEKIRDRLTNNYPEYCNCGFVYNKEKNHLIPVMQNNVKKSSSTDSVLLPIDVRAGGFHMIVQQEDINGQRLATLEEIRKVIENTYPEYSKERTEMIYDETKKIVIPILKSSRKGLIVHNLRPAWEHKEIVDGHGDRWRKEVRPFGIFSRNETQSGELTFLMTSPKIPRYILNEIEKRFRCDPSREAALQIFYDPETQEYEIYEPIQRKSSSSVHFIRNSRLELEKALVMDVHSHGRMKAFFSSIDDDDEKGVQLYMVLGNLDCKQYSIELRAGMVGHFASLTLDSVFEGGI